MHNIDVVTPGFIASVFAAALVGAVWFLHHKWPKQSDFDCLGDDIFLNVLTYDKYRSVAVVQIEVMKVIGDLIDPAYVLAALERLEEDGKAERRMRKKFLETRTLETPEYKRVSDLRPEDMGIAPLQSSDVPRQWASRR